MMRKFLILILFYGLMSHSWACDNIKNQIIDIRLRPVMTADLNLKKVGSILYSQQSSLAELGRISHDLACSDNVAPLNITGRMLGQETGRRVYQTSVPGIGIRILYHNRQSAMNEILKALPFSNTTVLSKNVPLRAEDIFLKIELVKVGAINLTQMLLFNQLSLLNFSSNNTVTNVNLHIMSKLPEPVCNFNSPQIFGHLPAQTSSTITIQKPKKRYPLPISISCNGEPNLMTMTLHGDAYDESQGILNVEEASNMAKGVGIQFWYRTHPLMIGKPFPINKLESLKLDNQIVLPFFVSYVKTKGSVIPGKLNVVATLHINYL